MAATDPKVFLEKLDTYEDEQRLQIITNILNWVETGKAKGDELAVANERIKELKELNSVQKEQVEFYKQQVAVLKDEVGTLRSSGGKRASDPAMEGEIRRLQNANAALLREKNELTAAAAALKKQAAAAAAAPSNWAEEKKKLETQVANLKHEADFQRNRADQAVAEATTLRQNLDGLAARVQELNSQNGNWTAQRTAYEQQIMSYENKISAHIQSNRELTEKIKKNDKLVLQAQSREKEIEKYKDAEAKWKIERARLADINAKLEATVQEFRAKQEQNLNYQRELQKKEDEKRNRRISKSTAMPGEEAIRNAPTMEGVGEAPVRKQRPSGNSADALMNENAALKKQLEDLQNAGSGELESLKAENQRQANTNERLRQEINQLNKAKLIYDVKIRQLQEAGDRASASAADKKKLEEENRSLVSQLKILERELNALRKGEPVPEPEPETAQPAPAAPEKPEPAAPAEAVAEPAAPVAAPEPAPESAKSKREKPAKPEKPAKAEKPPKEKKRRLFGRKDTEPEPEQTPAPAPAVEEKPAAEEAPAPAPAPAAEEKPVEAPAPEPAAPAEAPAEKPAEAPETPAAEETAEPAPAEPASEEMLSVEAVIASGDVGIDMFAHRHAEDPDNPEDGAPAMKSIDDPEEDPTVAPPAFVTEPELARKAEVSGKSEEKETAEPAEQSAQEEKPAEQPARKETPAPAAPAPAEESKEEVDPAVYAMRISTDAVEIHKRKDAKFLVTNTGVNGNVRISDNAPRRKAYFVMIDDKAYPNPYFYRDFETGKQSFITVQQLRPLFELAGVEDGTKTYRLVAVEPAEIGTDKRSYEIKKMGKLTLEAIS